MAEEELPARKRSRYSREPDLKVIVEDETFHVHSRDLMGASDVFANMLETDMRECEEGQIVLPGKSKEEFRTVIKHISVAYGEAKPYPAINTENVELLLKWADEYQIVGLKFRCEEFLKQELNGWRSKDIVGRLHLAVEYKLEQLQEKATELLAKNIYKYRCEAAQFIDNPSIMKVLLPELFKQACLEPPSEFPAEKVKAQDLWPLVTRSLEAMQGIRKIEDCHWLAQKYKEVVDAVFLAIPEHNPSNPLPEGLSVVDIKKIFSKRFGEEFVKKAVQALAESNSIYQRAGTSKYIRTWLMGHNVFSNQDSGPESLRHHLLFRRLARSSVV